MTKTFEKQYIKHFKYRKKFGDTKLSVVRNSSWGDDPTRLLFEMSRYKFVAKILSGKKNVLEVGCGDAFYSRIILQEINNLCAIDIDKSFIDEAKQNMHPKWKFQCIQHDILKSKLMKKFDAAFSLDVIEHIPKKYENKFVLNIIKSLNKNGSLIIGTPSKESQKYASKLSKIGHVNCKTSKELKILLSKYFHNVFLFSMNDEVLHTGYKPMSHYLFALCSNIK